MSEERDQNPLIQRVDALIRRQQEDSQRAVQEVPLLTEVVDPAAAPPQAKEGGEAMVEDIERVLMVRLIPELNKQVGALRGELEKQLRRAVREAVAHAIAQRKTKPGKP